ncbi:hypothetical protein L6452_19760 [Arctium lappa]|uniref:Uncharacterized protein n=1 Tax=Arctium lappa TaxID=4217 RepID=A0ACB9BA98_ARCLA|nr:hypothetical protein L6452_19760 [Arctium lappa]
MKKTKAADKNIGKMDKISSKSSGAPKRPPAAFSVFMEEFRKEYKENFPNNKSVSPFLTSPFVFPLSDIGSKEAGRISNISSNGIGSSSREMPSSEGEEGGLACKLESIIESPLVNGYCNKCEFSVRYSLQGKPTVGFSLRNFRKGVTPLDCPNVSRIGCKYVEVFQNFLQTSSFPIWNRMNNVGFLRQLKDLTNDMRHHLSMNNTSFALMRFHVMHTNNSQLRFRILLVQAHMVLALVLVSAFSRFE